MVEKYGDWFSYDKTPRSLIIDRDHGKIVDMESFVTFMRYKKNKIKIRITENKTIGQIFQ